MIKINVVSKEVALLVVKNVFVIGKTTDEVVSFLIEANVVKKLVTLLETETLFVKVPVDALVIGLRVANTVLFPSKTIVDPVALLIKAIFVGKIDVFFVIVASFIKDGSFVVALLVGKNLVE